MSICLVYFKHKIKIISGVDSKKTKLVYEEYFILRLVVIAVEFMDSNNGDFKLR